MTATPPPLPRPPIRSPHIEWPTAVVLCAMLAALVAVWAIASPEQRADMLTGVAAVGGVALAFMRAVLRAKETEPTTAPPPSANGLDRSPPSYDDGPPTKRRPTMLQRTAVGAAMLMLTGCGASALSTHATIAVAMEGGLVVSRPLLAPACDVAASACAGDAVCFERVDRDCRAAVTSWELARSAVLAYIEALQAADIAGTDGVLPALGMVLATSARTWASTVSALALVGVTLPALPTEASSLLATVGGAP